MAHEINHPLGSILINAQRPQSQLGALPATESLRALEPLGAIQRQEAEQTVATIERMRMLLRTVQTEPEAVDLGEVVSSALRYQRSLIEAHVVAVERAGLDQPHRLEGDPVLLQIAVATLVRNAVEACSQAQVAAPRFALRLDRIEAAAGPAWLDLRVADNGPGFGDLAISPLPLTTAKAEGSGSGLSVARTTAENHGGSLTLGRSPSLGGAEVLLRLPAC